MASFFYSRTTTFFMACSMPFFFSAFYEVTTIDPAQSLPFKQTSEAAAMLTIFFTVIFIIAITMASVKAFNRHYD